MNFKKNISIFASIMFICATMMFVAAGAAERSTFGENTNVIYSSTSGDVASATILKNFIDNLCEENSCSLDNETITIGEMELVKTSSQPLYLGDYLNLTKTTFTDSQLPTVLASGEVEGDNGKDYDYDLKISIPTNKIVYGETTDDFNTPIIYADFETDESYSLRVIFPTAIHINESAGELITLFGKEYSFSEDENDLTTSSITLFEKSTSVIINSGETKIVDGHSIRADIEDRNSATIYVNSISKNVDDDDWTGKIDGVDIHVKNIFAANIESGSRFVEISLNAEKLTLEDGEEVELGTSSIEGTKVEIKNSGDKVREIAITITPSELDDEIEYLKLGDSLTDPVFKTISFMLDSVTPELKSDDRDYIKVRTTGKDDANIVFTNKAGGEYDFEFIKNGNFNLQNKTVLKDDYFITGSNEYTQIWKLEKVNTDEIKVKDQASDSDSLELSVSDTGSAELSLADGSSVILDVNEDNIVAPKTAYKLYTENGAKIEFLNTTNNPIINITEETDYNGGTFSDNSGTSIGKIIGIYSYYDNGDLELRILDNEYTYSNDDDTYSLTRYGSYIKESNENKVEVYYPHEAMEINFYIGEISSEIKTTSIDGQVSQVIVGGSCINSDAASLLGGAYCGTEFTSVTRVGAGQALIQVFSDGSNVKVLLAGYEAADTTRAVDYLKNNNIDLTPGYKLII